MSIETELAADARRMSRAAVGERSDAPEPERRDSRRASSAAFEPNDRPDGRLSCGATKSFPAPDCGETEWPECMDCPESPELADWADERLSGSVAIRVEADGEGS